MSFCSICYEEDDEKTYTTKCNHKFHYKCLYKWLYDYNEFKECPLCKTILPDSEDILSNKISVTGNLQLTSFNAVYPRHTYFSPRHINFPMERFPDFGRPISIWNNLINLNNLTQQIRVIPPQPHMEHEVLFEFKYPSIRVIPPQPHMEHEVLFEFKCPSIREIQLIQRIQEIKEMQKIQKIQKIQERQERKERKNYHKFNNKIINITNNKNKRFFIPQTKQRRNHYR